MTSIKLWHDDIRPAPKGWTWARTNDAAEHLLWTYNVEEISLDHDLGLDYITEKQIAANPEVIFVKGSAEETGFHLVHWMIENRLVPEKITIHSWNIDRAKEMAETLNDAGYDVTVAPYIPKGVTITVEQNDN